MPAIPLATAAAWLTDQLGDTPPPVGINWLPTTPDEIVVLTASGGTPPTMDGLMEGRLLHARCRAATDTAAETLALRVHTIFSPITLGGSVTMGSTHVVCVTPTTPPMFLGRDVQRRTIYLASYLIEST